MINPKLVVQEYLRPGLMGVAAKHGSKLPVNCKQQSERDLGL